MCGYRFEPRRQPVPGLDRAERQQQVAPVVQERSETGAEAPLRQRAFFSLFETLARHAELAREIPPLVDERVKVPVGEVGFAAQPSDHGIRKAIHRKAFARVAERAGRATRWR